MIEVRDDEVLWVEKYRPQKLKDVILPTKLKQTLQGHIDNGFIPNLTFAGPPGVGKTTAAGAMFQELGFDVYFINSSLKGNIDTLRTDITDFASAVSFSGKRKYILLDEADYLNPNSTQPALRGVIEEFSRNCGFILTCNYPGRLLEAITSRCPVVRFDIPNDERETLAMEFFGRIQDILKAEGVAYDEAVVAQTILSNFPDWRKTINILQQSIKNDKIAAGINQGLTNDHIPTLYGFLRNSDFKKVREWCAEHSGEHPRDIFRGLYEHADGFLSPSGIAQLAITLNKYEYNAAFVANQEINLVAAMVEIMTEAEFQ